MRFRKSSSYVGLQSCWKGIEDRIENRIPYIWLLSKILILWNEMKILRVFISWLFFRIRIFVVSKCQRRLEEKNYGPDEDQMCSKIRMYMAIRTFSMNMHLSKFIVRMHICEMMSINNPRVFNNSRVWVFNVHIWWGIREEFKWKR